MIQRFNQSSNVMEILEERLCRVGTQIIFDETVDFIDIFQVIRVDPDDGDDVEEILSFGEVFRIREDSLFNCTQQFLYNFIKLNESFTVKFLKSNVDGFKQLQGVVQNLVIRIIFEVVDTDRYYTHYEILETNWSYVLNVSPQRIRWNVFIELRHYLFNKSADVSEGCQRVTTFGQLVVLQNNSGLMQVG